MAETKLAVSERITLRRFDPRDQSDVDAYFAWASDDEVMRFSSYDTFESKRDLEDFLARVVLPHPWYRAICLDGRPVGAISVTPAGPGDRHRAEIGYILARKHWGKGIATAAVGKALRAVGEEMPEVERVEALAEVENAASQKVLEKAGFVMEGVLRRYWMLKGRPRDMVIYSFLFPVHYRQKFLPYTKMAEETQQHIQAKLKELSINQNAIYLL